MGLGVIKHITEFTVFFPAFGFLLRGSKMQYRIKAKDTKDLPSKCKAFDNMIVNKKEDHALPHCEDCHCVIEDYNPNEGLEETEEEVGE